MISNIVHRGTRATVSAALLLLGVVALLLSVHTATAVGPALSASTPPPSATGDTGQTAQFRPRAVQSASPVPTCGLYWRVVPSVDPGTDDVLNGVAVVSSDDIWAVGTFTNGSDNHTLTEHWNGATWSAVSSPSPGLHNVLTGVSAVSSSDVWAAGFYDNGPENSGRTLVEHWDGSTWSVADAPNASPYKNWLNGIATGASNNVWVVGLYYAGVGGDPSTLTEHWNGFTWTIVASPNVGTLSNVLNSVSATRAGDVWAVGSTGDSGTPAGVTPLILHWSGTSWVHSVAPPPPPGDTVLTGVAGTDVNRVFAVGYTSNADSYHTYVIHYNGDIWSQESSPNPSNQVNVLLGVAMDAPGGYGVWAVGHQAAPGHAHQTLVEYRDAGTWVVQPSPNNNVASNGLNAVAVDSLLNVWAVGGYWPSDAYRRTLVERYNDPCGTPIPTPSVEPSSTPTPSATPITCDVQITDVPPGSPFYAYIECLACQGLMNGYVCGGTNPQTGQPEPCDSARSPYFRPGNDASRQQLAKIVSNAAGLTDVPGTQLFQDVPLTSTYYNYIYRLAHRGYISGYPCGSDPAEPCVPPSNLPYFRPTATTTRAQMAKIVANTAGFTDSPGPQLFQDVPVGSPFYDYINRLANRNSVAGYPCGPAGRPLPCMPPTYLPYFLPNTEVTRGQAAKITSNTFFPECAVGAER